MSYRRKCCAEANGEQEEGNQKQIGLGNTQGDWKTQDLDHLLSLTDTPSQG